jgi:hypothetical protein
MQQNSSSPPVSLVAIRIDRDAVRSNYFLGVQIIRSKIVASFRLLVGIPILFLDMQGEIL